MTQRAHGDGIRGVHPPTALTQPFILPFSPLSFLPFPPFPYSVLPSRFPCHSFLPLEVGPLNPARGLGERCKFRQRGLGQSPSRNRIWQILALKYGIWWQQFQ